MKKEYIILLLIILSLVLYLFMRNPDRTNYQLPEIPEITQDEISRIEINKPDITVVLNRKGKDWTIAPEDYPANSFNVESMLAFIARPVLTAMVSESKNYERYGLDKNKKIVVRALSGESLRREIEVGDTTPAFRHTFIKLAGDYRVYHAQKNQREQFDRTVDELRDKSVLAFQKGEIKKIDFTRGTQVFSFTKTEDSPGETSEKDQMKEGKPETIWKSSNGEKADESVLEDLLTALSDLSCNNYLYDIKKEDLSDPLCILKLEGEKEYILSIFPKKDSNIQAYPSVSSENSYPFMLIGWKAEKIMKVFDSNNESDKKDENPGS